MVQPRFPAELLPFFPVPNGNGQRHQKVPKILVISGLPVIRLGTRIAAAPLQKMENGTNRSVTYQDGPFVKLLEKVMVLLVN